MIQGTVAELHKAIAFEGGIKPRKILVLLRLISFYHNPRWSPLAGEARQ